MGDYFLLDLFKRPRQENPKVPPNRSGTVFTEACCGKSEMDAVLMLHAKEWERDIFGEEGWILAIWEEK